MQHLCVEVYLCSGAQCKSPLYKPCHHRLDISDGECTLVVVSDDWRQIGPASEFSDSRLLTLRSPSVLLYDWWITESCTVLPVAALSRYFALLYYLPYKQQMVSFPNLDFNIWSWFLCSLFHWKALNCQSNFFDPDNLAIFFFYLLHHFLLSFWLIYHIPKWVIRARSRWSFKQKSRRVMTV